MKPLRSHALACLLLLLTLGSNPAHAAADLGPDALNAVLALRDAHKLAEAEEAARALTVARGQAYGGADLRTLEAWMLLTDILGAQNLGADMESQIMGLLPYVMRVYGAESIETLKLESNLITSLIKQEKHAETAVRCRSVLPVLDKVLGPEADTTLHARWNLAKIMRDQGRLDEAAVEYRQVLALYEHLGKAVENEKLLCHCDLVTLLVIAAQYAEVKDQCRSLIPAAIQVLGPKNRKTLETRLNGARALYELKQPADAEKESREVLPQCKQVLGAESPETLNANHILALCLKELNKPQDALPYAQAALTGRQKLLGQDHADTQAAQRLVDELKKAGGKA